MKKVKIQKNKGVMEFVVCIMANPLSNRGAFLSHSSQGPPYGKTPVNCTYPQIFEGMSHNTIPHNFLKFGPILI